MIKRTNDYSSLFSEKELSKIASAVENSSKRHLYDVFDNAELARVAKKELKVQGYHADIYQAGDKWKVYVNTPDTISLKEAESTGAFKKLAWGRYCFNRNSSLEMHDYPFDDGSIWKVSTDENGNTVLIKEVSNENEDEVIRKTANLQKTANSPVVNEFNYKNAFDVLFTITSLNPAGDEFLNKLFEGVYKMDIINLLNESIESRIDEIAQQNMFDDTEGLIEIKNEVSNMLNSAQFNLFDELENFVESAMVRENAENDSQENI